MKAKIFTWISSIILKFVVYMIEEYLTGYHLARNPKKRKEEKRNEDNDVQ